MSDNTPRPTRSSVRMNDYDYSLPGFYLVTICIKKRTCLFGEIGNGAMHLNDAGLVAQTMWESLAQRFSTLQLDSFVIMPNHMHGIIELIAPPTISEGRDDKSRIPLRFQAHMQREATKKASPTLGQIVRVFKGVTTHDIRKAGRSDFEWQGGYHESVLRNDRALDHARNYIVNNPLTWMEDSLHF